MTHNGSGIPKVLLYFRVSKDEQRTEGFSIETQRDRCLAKCTEIYGLGRFEGYEIIDDESGAYGLEKTGVAKKTRPGLRKAAELLMDGSFDALIVYKVDRFFRSTRWLNQFLEDVLIPSNTELISATEDINTKSAGGMMYLQILALMAAWQRQSIVDRNKDAAAKRREEGFIVGQIGFGWKWEPIDESKARSRRGILPVAEEGQWIQRISEWYLAGWGSARIASELNKLGVLPPCGEGKWGSKAVLSIAGNPLNAGLVPAGDGLIEGQHFEHRHYAPEVFYRLQEERKGRKRWRTNTQHTQRHLLAGIITCAECGRKLRVGIASGLYRSYRCLGELSPEGDKCRRVYLNANLIEEVMLSQVGALAESEQVRRVASEEAQRILGSQDQSLVAEREQLRHTVSKLQSQFTKWAEALTSETITNEQFRDFNAELVQRRNSAEERLTEVEAALSNRERREDQFERVVQALRDFPGTWKHLTFDERRQLLSLLIEEVTAERIGRDMTVRIKLYLCPEREITVPIPSVRDGKTRPKGVDGLTLRQLALLKHIGDGRTKEEISVLWDVTPPAVYAIMKQVRDYLGMHDLDEAARLAEPRISTMLPYLPLKGRSRHATTMANAQLSDRLRSILGYVASGATNPEIARLTGLKLSTVAGRRTRLLEFFEVSSVYEMVQRAKAAGML